MARLAGKFGARGAALSVAVAIVATLAVTACTPSSGVHTQTGTEPTSPSVARTTVTAAPSSAAPTAESATAKAAKAATAAYVAFFNASRYAEMKPGDESRRSSLRKYASQTALAAENSTLLNYAYYATVWRGTPPKTRTRIISIKLAPNLPQTVVLRNCPTVSSTWQAYNAKTGKRLSVTWEGATAKPPFGITATVTYSGGHWMVETTESDLTKTCAP